MKSQQNSAIETIKAILMLSASMSFLGLTIAVTVFGYGQPAKTMQQISRDSDYHVYSECHKAAKSPTDTAYCDTLKP